MKHELAALDDLGCALDDAPGGRMTEVMARSAVMEGRRPKSCARQSASSFHALRVAHPRHQQQT